MILLRLFCQLASSRIQVHEGGSGAWSDGSGDGTGDGLEALVDQFKCPADENDWTVYCDDFDYGNGWGDNLWMDSDGDGSGGGIGAGYWGGASEVQA